MRRKYTRDLTGVDLVVTGVPLDTATTNRPGARFGPRGIRAASACISWMRPYGTAVDPFDKLAVIDYGDCFFDFGRPETVPDAIEAHASSIIDQGPGLLTLGGDHFIAWPLLKAHAKKHGKPLSLLHFDAHSDTWEDEEGRVDHGTMFWHAAKEGLVDPAKSVQIGLHPQGSRRQSGLPEFRYRLPRPKLCSWHGHAGLRRAFIAPGNRDSPRAGWYQCCRY
jgi:agmatinase